MDWEKLFAASSAQLKASLAEVRASVAHRGLKGNANEQAVAEWLRLHLPGAIEVCTGEVVDSRGGRSKQVDVLLYDYATTPKFFVRDGVTVLPVEPIFGAVEVKTFLNKSEIEASFENMKALKALTKVAYHPNRSLTHKMLYGKSTEHWPLQFFIFAYESDSLSTVFEHVQRLNSTQPVDKRIDMVCILDKGLVLYLDPVGLQPIPTGPDSKLIAKESDKALLTFYALLTHLMSQAATEPLSLAPYLAHIKH